MSDQTKKKDNGKVSAGSKEESKAEQKVVTRYDRKMQMRKEQKEKERKQQKIGSIVGIVILAALVCLVASFPIRTYLAVHENYVTVNGEDVTKIEFDYNYNIVKNSYLNDMGMYLYYMGVNIYGDLSTQMYSEDMTWQDYLEELTVESMIQNKALKAKAEEAGFTYDTSQEYKEYEQDVKDAASEAGSTVKSFLQQTYGSYATWGRLSDYIKDAIYVQAFYNQVAEGQEPSEEEIQEYYEEHTQDYDVVDYRMVTVQAELPTEPTELADQEDTEAAGTEGEAAGTDGETGDTEEETAYEPSQAEIDKAMADAKEEADAAEATVAQQGMLTEGVSRLSTSSQTRDWLFDDSRKAGDTTVIENSTGHCYYVLAFESRYLDQTPSADLRVLVTDTMDGQDILTEWQNGAATEESFGELCEKYSIDKSSAASGGLYEGRTEANSGLDANVSPWVYEEERNAGDTTVIAGSDGNTYVLYYAGANDPQWKLSIRNLLLAQRMEEYLAEISEGIEVADPSGNLKYLKLQEQEASQEENGADSGTQDTEDAGTEGSSEMQDTEAAGAEGEEPAGSSGAAE